MKAAPLVTIELDRERHLLLDLNAMVLFEELAGKPLWSLGKDITAKELRLILWITMLPEDRELTLEQVGAMIHPGSIPDLTKKVTELMKLMLSQPEREVEDVRTKSG